MKKYAILRFQKIKTFSQLSAHSNHVLRKRETLNADQDSLHAPQAILGSGDHGKDAREAIEKLSKPPRKNSVLAIEAILTASPEWLRDAPGTFNAERTVELTKAAKTFLEKQFPDCPITATLHLDESTPHIHATIVPVDRTVTARRTEPRLNAGKWLDGADKLSALQDAWADATAHLGLDRGERGSKATHQSVKRLYGALESDAKQTATEREKTEALTIGIDAWTAGKIIDATESSRGKTLAVSHTLSKEQRDQLGKQIKPAFNEVWLWIAQRTNELKKAKETAMKAVNEMLLQAKELAPYLDDASKNRAAKLAFKTKSSSSILKTKDGPQGR